MKKLFLVFVLAVSCMLSAVGYAQTKTVKSDSTLYKKYLTDYKETQSQVIRSNNEIVKAEKQLQQMRDLNNSLRGSLNTIAFYLQQEKNKLDSLKVKTKVKK